MPAAPFENRIADALMAALNLIGPVGASWLTNPSKAEGTPANALSQPVTNPQLYLQFVRTVPNGQESVPARHAWRSYFTVWIVAKDLRSMMDAKGDVLRTVYQQEAAIIGIAGQPAWPDDFTYRDEMSTAALAVGAQSVFVDYDSDHTNP